jgi:hypothetical protein
MPVKCLVDIFIYSDEISSDSEAGQEKENLTQPYSQCAVSNEKK